MFDPCDEDATETFEDCGRALLHCLDELQMQYDRESTCIAFGIRMFETGRTYEQMERVKRTIG